MGLVKDFNSKNLNVRIYTSRKCMGAAAAADVGNKIKELLQEKEEVNVIFAAAPSQNEFLEELVLMPGIQWNRVNAFHMDEYIGLAPDAPQGFGNFLKKRIFSRLPFKNVNIINGSSADIQNEYKRYGQLLKDSPVDIVCLGIGENGHIAFNDPHVAKFDDTHLVKEVELDSMCRMQQVNDGCFNSIEDVPTHAVTLTIPALYSAKYMFCIVPGTTKSQAVFDTVRGKITEDCPASILQKHENAFLYTDVDSGNRIILRKSVITDEISQDFEEAAKLAADYGLEAVEIRSVWEKGPHELDDSDIRKIKDILRKYSLKISAVSAPVFKCDMDNSDEVKENYRILKKCIKLAHSLETTFIRGFTFWAKGNFSKNILKIVNLLRPAADILEKERIVMAIETEPSVNAGNAEKLVRILKNLNSPAVKALWDPGNDIFEPGGETPYPEGYKIIKPYMVHMHLKDAKVNSAGKAESVAVGDGEVLYKEHFKELLMDGYDGYIALETHYRKKIELDESLQHLPKGSAFSYMGREATIECFEKWDNLMNEVFMEF